MEQSIKELRIAAGMTQKQVATITGIPLRTYKNYENDKAKEGTIKYNYIVDILKEKTLIDEEHGILTVGEIESACDTVFSKTDVEYCILFGSYSKGEATETSDVDLLISTKISGLKYFGLAENLRKELGKKVDLLNINQLENNPALLNQVLKDGIRVYEK